ncbi:MAG TPA: SHOCT domain-containing protein [Streptosporangiaceae bacterium]|nr:SHOCT domain-containing protein [Streptosporangiaceae bacterium]
MDTFIVFAASYDTLGAAEADYHAVRDFYLTSGLLDTYDAAVITRDDAGKVRIVLKHEQPTRQGAWRGLGIGLVGGALVALFPAVGLGAGLLLGATGGAGLGALAGHVSAGLKRADLKDLGELLDEGHSGLVVVAASDLGDRVEHAIRRASKLTSKPLRADEEAAGQDIEAATASHPDQGLQEAVAESEAAVREAEREAEAAERAAEQYSAFGSRPATRNDLASQLDDLARLRDRGVLSQAEFEAAKASMLGG